MYQDWIAKYDEIVNQHKRKKELTINKKFVNDIVVEVQVQTELANIWKEEMNKEKEKRIELEDELIILNKTIEDILRKSGALGRIPKSVYERFN